MGADTQTSRGDRDKITSLGENNLKITRMPHGILLGHAGAVRVTQILACHKDWFEELGDEPLTKRFLVMRIIPRYYRELKERDLLDAEDSTVQYGGGFIVAQGDRIFVLNGDFSVDEVPSFVSIGCGQDAANLVRQTRAKDGAFEREETLLALRLSASVDRAVGAPFVLIDTKDLQFEYVKE